MNDPTISCPKCGTTIRLDESLAAPLVKATRAEYEKQLLAKDAEVAARETQIRTQQAALREKEQAVVKAQGALDEQVASQVDAKLREQRTVIVAEEARKAKLLVAADMAEKARETAELQDVLREREQKLAEAQKAQADLVRERREIEDATRELELTVQKRVSEGVTTAREQGRREADDAAKLKLAERDLALAGMQRQVDEMKRKLEQGSQQAQGEVQELELEAQLRERFPFDVVEPVPKGEYGGDALQRVRTPAQQLAGTILWESKRTKNWSDGWLAKLREDQRSARAEVAVIVSAALPGGVELFDCIDGVWVCSPRAMLPIAFALRQGLLDLAGVRQAAVGQQTKMELVYDYLTGIRFRQRVEAMIEAFSEMREDLDKERKVLQRHWAKRESQIERMIAATAGMYGDLQGIAGRSLKEIDGLDIKLLGGPNEVDASGHAEGLNGSS